MTSTPANALNPSPTEPNITAYPDLQLLMMEPYALGSLSGHACTQPAILLPNERSYWIPLSDVGLYRGWDTMAFVADHRMLLWAIVDELKKTRTAYADGKEHKLPDTIKTKQDIAGHLKRLGTAFDARLHNQMWEFQVGDVFIPNILAATYHLEEVEEAIERRWATDLRVELNDHLKHDRKSLPNHITDRTFTSLFADDEMFYTESGGAPFWYV